MAGRRKIKRRRTSRNRKRRPVAVTKPQATEEQMLDMARRYRTVYPWDTPESIFKARNKVHEEMAWYSNPEEIDHYMRDYKDEPNNVRHTLAPMVPIFPGYQPIRNSSGTVIGYEPSDSRQWVPEGFVPLNYTKDNETLNGDNVYPPDFHNTFLWYTNPGLQSPVVDVNDSQSPEDLIVSNEELVNEQFPIKKYEELTPEILDQYDDMLREQFNYASEHNRVFDYANPEIGKFMDTYDKSPDQLFTLLKGRYGSPVANFSPVSDATHMIPVSSTIDYGIDSVVDIPENQKEDKLYRQAGNRKVLYGPINRDQFMISQDMDDIKNSSYKYQPTSEYSDFLDQAYNFGQLLDRYIYRKSRVRDANTGKVKEWWPIVK